MCKFDMGLHCSLSHVHPSIYDKYGSHLYKIASNCDLHFLDLSLCLNQYESLLVIY